MCQLLVAALFMQDIAAEEAFKKLEALVSNATTLRVTFKVEGGADQEGGRATYTEEGSILLGKDHKFSVSCIRKQSFKDKEEQFTVRIVSDGSRMFFSSDGKQWVDKRPPSYEIQNFKDDLILLGASATAHHSGSFGALTTIGGGGLVPKESIRIANLRHGPKTERGSTLLFSAKYSIERFSDQVHQSEATVEYDPQTFKILSRKIIFNAGNNASLIETFGDFTSNADIPDEAFRIPEEKK